MSMLIINMQLGLGNKLKSRHKWTGMKVRRELFMINRARRKNYTRHKEQRTCKQRFNSG